MPITSKAAMPITKQYVNCNSCSMQAICQPIGSKEQALDLTSNYLTRHVEVNTDQSSSPQLTQAIGVRLFEQEQPLTAIYAVCSGTFKLCQRNAAGVEKVVGFRFPGELMAEDALYLAKYNYSAIALGDNSVCQVFIEQFSACSKLAPELQHNLIQLLTKQSFEQQHNTQVLIGKKSAESLLVAFLLNICQRSAKHSGSATELELSISRHDIASFLGIRRETVSRLLSKLQQEQLITLHNKQLSLLCLESLKKLTES